MKTKLILKGILLWFTAIITIMWLLALPNLIDANRIDLVIIFTAIIINFNYVCYNTISYKELLVLSLYKYMDNLWHNSNRIH